MDFLGHVITYTPMVDDFGGGDTSPESALVN